MVRDNVWLSGMGKLILVIYVKPEYNREKGSTLNVFHILILVRSYIFKHTLLILWLSQIDVNPD
jgi:hypothetical protein